ncbi:MAG: hypothetical protein CMN30_04300 [Sandaracinus sp.]|nr:hypothetical protein [Sandaracinus sp.]
MNAVFLLREAGIRGPTAPILSGITASIRDRATTVLLGPGGTGKSLFLRSLAGRPLPEHVGLEGAWLRSGPDVTDMWWGPQKRREDPEPAQDVDWDRRLLLIDEPALPDECSRRSLAERLAAHSRRGAAVVVTHDVAFARAVADDVYLLCAGGIAARGATPFFFDEPPGPLAQRFVHHGNVWPTCPEEISPLPSHFRWYVPGRLGGMGTPGLLQDVECDLRALQQAGVRTLLSLTEEPFRHPTLGERRIYVRHFGIRDMDVPPLARTASLCRDIARLVDQGERVVVHCRAGLGRTGTILAAYHVWCGDDPERAIQRVRDISPRSIQTTGQERFVTRFAESLAPA